MNRKTFVSLIMTLLCVVTFISCDDEKETVQYTIQTDPESISAGVNGSEETIQLTSNGEWEIKEIPGWISVTPTSGDESAEITLVIHENREPEGREVNLIFVCKDKQASLQVSQSGLRDIDWSPQLPGFSFEQIKFQEESNTYEVETGNLFVNPDIKDKIYLGNLVSHNAPSNTSMIEFTDYTFNPITVLTTTPVSGEITRNYIPSLANQDDFAKQVIAQKPTQNGGTQTGNPKEFYDHQQLYTCGMINMGLELDKIVSGSSFTEKEMTKKYGLLYSFKQTLFKLLIDRPIDPFVREEIKEADIEQGVSFVDIVSYGRVALLIIESDTDPRIVKEIISKVMNNGTLTQEETNLLTNAEICSVYYNSGKEVQVEKGGLKAVQTYKEAIEDLENIYPVDFGVSSYPTMGMQNILFTIKIPE